MNDQELDNLVRAWIAGAEAEEYTVAKLESWWATETVMDLRKKPEDLWQFIITAYKQPMSEKAECVFAAGPLEDLISRHGQQYIDRIEELARVDDHFRDLLGGVWQSLTPAEVWSRIEAIRDEPWGP